MILQQVTGSAKSIILADEILRQVSLQCGCRVEHSSAYSYLTATIGGKRFHANERLIRGKRCGSVVITVVRGRSLYGLAKKFIRVICPCMRSWDFALITWFPRPVYPNSDPLTVRIDWGGIDVNNIVDVNVVSLNDIQPSRVAVGIDSIHNNN